MSILPINLGQSANDGTGDFLRVGGQIINANFVELDDRTEAAQTSADQAQTSANNKQPGNANLTALSNLAGIADRLPYFTGTGAMSLAALTAKARALLARTDIPGMQSELGLVPVTSPADITTGRVMTVGYMGLGAEVIALGTAGSINAVRKTGFYYSSSTGDTPESYGFVTHLSVGATDGSQEFVSIITGYRYYRILSNNAWTPWEQSITSVSATRDPQLNTGGLMSYTVVSGWSIYKYASGKIEMISPFDLVGSSFAANELRVVDIALPFTLSPGKNTSVSAVVVPGAVYDFSVPSCWLINGSQARLAIKNGANPQAFNKTLTVMGGWN